MNVHEYIDDYVAGNLNGDLLQQFEAAMKEDESLRLLVEDYSKIQSVSEGIGELTLLDEVENISLENSSKHTENATENKQRSKPKPNRPILILAFLTSMIVSYFLVKYLMEKNRAEEPTQIFAEVYREPLWPIERSDEEDVLQQAVSSYVAHKNLNLVKPLLLKSLDNKQLGNYWLAEMYANQEKMDSSMYYLHQSNISNGDAQFERRCYLEALDLVLKGDLNQAKISLSKIGNAETINSYSSLLGI